MSSPATPARPQRQSPGAVLILLPALVVAAVPARGQSACAEAIPQAEEAYYSGLFDQGITTVRWCVEGGELDRDGTDPAVVVRAYTLLGRLYHAQGREREARAALRELMTRVPEYRPDPLNEEPSFVALAESVREEMGVAGEPMAVASEGPPARAEEEGESPDANDGLQPPRPSASRKSPVAATMLGVVIPGGGHFYSGEAFKGTVLLAGAVVGILIVGEEITIGPADYDETVIWIGAGLVGVTWLYSIIDASGAARRRNARNGLAGATVAPAVTPGGAGVAVAIRL